MLKLLVILTLLITFFNLNSFSTDKASLCQTTKFLDLIAKTCNKVTELYPGRSCIEISYIVYKGTISRISDPSKVQEFNDWWEDILGKFCNFVCQKTKKGKFDEVENYLLKQKNKYCY